MPKESKPKIDDFRPFTWYPDKKPKATAYIIVIFNEKRFSALPVSYGGSLSLPKEYNDLYGSDHEAEHLFADKCWEHRVRTFSSMERLLVVARKDLKPILVYRGEGKWEFLEYGAHPLSGSALK